MPARDRSSWGGSDVVVGIDNGGTANNATVLDLTGRFLVDTLVELPSKVTQGPGVAIPAMADSVARVLEVTAVPRSAVRAVGLDTPGPASADGVISSLGGTNFVDPAWRGFDVRSALQDALGIPVVYNNDGNAAALYAHHVHFGDRGGRSSVSAIVGTGLGGGVVEHGVVVSGAAGMAGELGHITISLDGLLADGQPVPRCNCGNSGDVESVASLTGITKNLLPYWLTRYPDHPLHEAADLVSAARQVRKYAERGDELALKVFEQQPMAIGRLFTVAAHFTDPAVYFVGGGVVESAPHFREWFLQTVRANTSLRAEQAKVAEFATVPDLDMAGARGSAFAALERVRSA
jgi:predicted NBD/HSP70 family sugar kinase